MTQVIELVITTAGQTTIETRGFSGPACQEASRAFERALGAVHAERLTPEYFQAIDQRHQARES
jgi:hypothetical protein